MVRSTARSATEYLGALPSPRREAIGAVREVILANLPVGYEEAMRWGMLSYEVPLERYPHTYNGEPLGYAGLASQKSYMSLYLMGVYGERELRFRERYLARGKPLDMGRSCVRFRSLEDLPLDLIAETIASTSVEDFISAYEARA